MSSQLNFVNYDFDDLVEQLTNRLKERDAWKDTYRSSTGQMLIELFAYIANMVLYYVERRAEESYILTAKNKSSIINLVRLLNYVPKRKVSSTGVLKFTLSGGASSKIVFIPQYTECQTSAGLKFLTNEEAAIMPGQTYAEVQGVQGELITLNYVGNGEANQEYKIDDTSVENTNIFVTVAGTSWTKVNSFINSVSNSKHFILKTNLDDTVSIIFGDGVFGEKPGVGDTIEIKYIKSDGLDGNVYQTDKITTLNSAIYDEDGDIVDVTVTNSSTFLGGDDAESAEEIRNEAPQVFSTGDRAVTKEDFIAIINNYAGVADSNVWGENEESPPNYDMYNRVKLCVLLQNWEIPDSTFEDNLSDYLYDKSLMTVRYSFVTPEILYVVPTLTVKVSKGYSLTDVSSDITSALEDDFVLGSTTKLGTSKRLSDIVALIEAVEGVSYSYTNLKLRKELSDTYDSTYDWAEILEATPILASSISVYAEGTEVATDDGSGHFTSTTSTYTVTGDIDYNTGVIGIDISPSVSSLVVKYNQDESGDIVVTKNQICKLYEVDIQSISYVS